MAKKTKVQKTNAIRLLEKHQISFTVHTFPWSEDHLGAAEAIEKLTVPKERIFKTLVTTGDKTGIVIAVIPGEGELDLKALAKVSGNKHVELLPIKELFAATGYIRGGCSPIGMKKEYPTYFSSVAQELNSIIVSAGKRGMQVELSPIDLKTVTNGEFAVIESNRKSHG